MLCCNQATLHCVENNYLYCESQNALYSVLLNQFYYPAKNKLFQMFNACNYQHGKFNFRIFFWPKWQELGSNGAALNNASAKHFQGNLWMENGLYFSFFLLLLMSSLILLQHIEAPVNDCFFGLLRPTFGWKWSLSRDRSYDDTNDQVESCCCCWSWNWPPATKWRLICCNSLVLIKWKEDNSRFSSKPLVVLRRGCFSKEFDLVILNLRTDLDFDLEWSESKRNECKQKVLVS